MPLKKVNSNLSKIIYRSCKSTIFVIVLISNLCLSNVAWGQPASESAITIDSDTSAGQNQIVDQSIETPSEMPIGNLIVDQPEPIDPPTQNVIIDQPPTSDIPVEQPVEESEEIAEPSNPELDSLNDNNLKNFNYKVEAQVGLANLDIPIEVPVGRKGLEPKIGVKYNSSVDNGWLGAGWNLELGSIQRSTKFGKPSYTLNDGFVFIQSGSSQDLATTTTAGQYKYKIENDFSKIQFVNNAYWLMTDKNGVKYFFGRTADSQIYNPSDSTKIFKWSLDKVEDLFGNYLTVTYQKITNQLYPQYIDYTGNSVSNDATYARVEFVLENTDRQDTISTYRPDFLITTSRRLADIYIRATNVLQRRYHFAYQNVAPTNRSVLSSIVQYDNTDANSLPAISFVYQNPSLSFARNPGYWLENFTINGTNDVLYPGDYNGDGLTDIVSVQQTPENGKRFYMLLSNGHSFVGGAYWLENFTINGNNDTLYPGDYNGDGLTDIVSVQPTPQGDRFYMLFSNGHGFVGGGYWLENVDLGAGHRLFPGDFNGDGLTDIASGIITNNGHSFGLRVFLSNGQSFICNTNDWYNGGNFDRNYLSLGDFNGDGLTDFVNGVVINNGHSFGLRVFLSNGHSFVSNTNDWYDLGNFDRNYLSLGDFNGDGLTDIVNAQPSGSGDNFVIFLSNGPMPHLLSSVNNNLGATTQIVYTPSTQYDNTGPDSQSDLPFAVQTVSRITVADQTLNQSYVTNYQYQDGFYDASDREFRGFGLIKKIDAVGNYVATNLLQDDIYQGKILEQRNYDSSDHLYSKTTNTWANQAIGNNINFPYLARVDNYTYDNDATGKRSQIQYYYEESPQYGNLTRTVELGEVNLSDGGDLNNTDNRTTTNQYLYNSTNWLVSLPKTSWVSNNANNVVKQDWFYYDNGSYNQAPTLGNLTKKESWLKTSTNSIPQANNIENPKTTFTYDAYGNLLTTTDPIGNTTTNPNDRITTVIYDSNYHIFPLVSINALGQRTTNAYYGVNGVSLNDGTYQGLFGQVKSIIDPNNVVLTNIYDGFGRLIKIIKAYDTVDLPTISTTYNLNSVPVNIITANRVEHNQTQTQNIITFYDGLGRALQTKSYSATTTHPYIASNTVTFNNRGLVERNYLNYYSDTFNNYSAPSIQALYTSTTYDPLGRPITILQPDGSRINLAYQDWVNSAIDPNGHLKKSYFDGFGKLVMVKEYSGADGRDVRHPQTIGQTDNYYTEYASTAYSYDISGNLIQTTDAENNISTATFDSLNRKIQTVDPDMGTWNYAYDLVGNLIRQVDAKNQTIGMGYDDLNRLMVKKFNSSVRQLISPPIIYYYDGNTNYSIGRLSRVAVGDQVVNYSYDALGNQTRELKQIGSGSFRFDKSYDALGRLKTLSYPGGETLTYLYNNQNQISQLRNQNNYYYVSEAVYNEANQPTYMHYGNGAQIYYTYDPQSLKLTNLQSTDANNQLIQNISYVYDSAKNIIATTDGVNRASQTFTYDHLNRLLTANNTLYGAESYSYSPIGNLLSHNGIRYTYQGRTKPHAVSSLSNGLTFTYDQNGNLASQSQHNNPTDNYQYDVENRLKTVTRNNQLLADFTYDEQGNRVKKSIYQTRLGGDQTPITTIYVGEYYEATGNEATNNIFFNGQKIATVTNGTPSYYHLNHLGSTDVMTDSAGRQTVHYEYLPFGSVATTVGNDATRYKFTGKEFDDATGLYYYSARYYNPAIGRFITPDTVIQSYADPQTLNRYSYVNNNPVNLTDPTGHIAFLPLFIAFGIPILVNGLMGAYQDYQASGGHLESLLDGRYNTNLRNGEISGLADGTVNYVGGYYIKGAGLASNIFAKGTVSGLGQAAQDTFSTGEPDPSNINPERVAVAGVFGTFLPVSSKSAANYASRSGYSTANKIYSSFTGEELFDTFRSKWVSTSLSSQLGAPFINEFISNAITNSISTSDNNVCRVSDSIDMKKPNLQPANYFTQAKNSSSVDKSGTGNSGGGSSSGGSGGSGMYFNETFGRPMPNPTGSRR